MIELSIEAGILLGGNGALHAMLVAAHIARSLTRCYWDHLSLLLSSSIALILLIRRVILIKCHAGQQC
jgi:hypothetical protein